MDLQLVVDNTYALDHLACVWHLDLLVPMLRHSHFLTALR